MGVTEILAVVLFAAGIMMLLTCCAMQVEATTVALCTIIYLGVGMILVVVLVVLELSGILV